MLSPLRLRRLTEWLLILGTALTIFWQPLARQIPLKASDIMFVLALCAWLLFILRRGRTQTFDSAQRRPIPPLVTLLGSLVLATLIGYLRYDLTMSREGIILLVRLAVCMALFLTTSHLLRIDTAFGRRVSLAFLSPVVLFPAMLVPALSAPMWESAGRFQGFTVNPNTADQAFCVALALAYTLAIHELRVKRPLRVLAFAAITAGMLILIVWTQSRAYLVGALASVLLSTILTAPKPRVPRLKAVAAALLAFLVIAAATILLAPRSFVNTYFKKISLQPMERTESPPHDPPASSNWELIDGKLAFGRHAALNGGRQMPDGIARKVIDSPHVQAALLYLQLLPSNPLGLGVNYEEKFFIYFSWSGARHHGTNSIVDILVYGGVGAVLSVGYMMGLVAKRTRERLTAEAGEPLPVAIGATAALAGLWIAAILLGSPIFDYQLWIVTAIALMSPGCDPPRS